MIVTYKYAFLFWVTSLDSRGRRNDVRLLRGRPLKDNPNEDNSNPQKNIAVTGLAGNYGSGGADSAYEVVGVFDNVVL